MKLSLGFLAITATLVAAAPTVGFPKSRVIPVEQTEKLIILDDRETSIRSAPLALVHGPLRILTQDRPSLAPHSTLSRSAPVATDTGPPRILTQDQSSFATKLVRALHQAILLRNAPFATDYGPPRMSTRS
jgi:hypothetical protein